MKKQIKISVVYRNVMKINFVIFVTPVSFDHSSKHFGLARSSFSISNFPTCIVYIEHYWLFQIVGGSGEVKRTNATG